MLPDVGLCLAICSSPPGSHELLAFLAIGYDGIYCRMPQSPVAVAQGLSLQLKRTELETPQAASELGQYVSQMHPSYLKPHLEHFYLQEDWRMHPAKHIYPGLMTMNIFHPSQQ